MRLTLSNDELNQALTAYVSSVGIDLSNKDVDINIAGKGANGTTAEIDINSIPAKKTVTSVRKTKAKAKDTKPVVELDKKVEPVNDEPPFDVAEENKAKDEAAEQVPVASKSLFA